jgi:hypothetical protein
LPDVIFMSSEYWESRYQTRDMPWEKGEPSPGLVDFLAEHPELPKGKVCVPGCGTGHDVRAWASAGFPVTGFDIATRAAGLSAEFRLANFLADAPPFPFDWVFEHTLFCAIQPGERDGYAKALSRWLATEGQYLAVNYLIPDRDGPPFGTTRDEVVERFSPEFDLVQEWVPRSYANRVGLERMFWWKRKRSSATS